MHRRRWFGSVCAVALAGWLAACAAAAPKPDDKPYAPALPLLALVPPAPQPVLAARPSVLFREQATHTLFRALIDADHEHAFAQRTGVDPRTLDELVAREEGDGYLALARGPFDAHEVVRRAGERLALPDVVTDTPRMRREGLAGQGRYAYAVLDEHTVLVAKDVPPQRVAQVFALQEAQGKAGLPSVLSTSPGRELAERYAGAPLALYVPAPLSLPKGSGFSLLLAEQKALVATVGPSGPKLTILIDLRGEFPAGADENFRTLGRSMSSNELMHMLGLSSVLSALAVEQAEGTVRIAGSVAAAELANGLRTLFFADARALFE